MAKVVINDTLKAAKANEAIMAAEAAFLADFDLNSALETRALTNDGTVETVRRFEEAKKYIATFKSISVVQSTYNADVEMFKIIFEYDNKDYAIQMAKSEEYIDQNVLSFAQALGAKISIETVASDLAEHVGARLGLGYVIENKPKKVCTGFDADGKAIWEDDKDSTGKTITIKKRRWAFKKFA